MTMSEERSHLRDFARGDISKLDLERPWSPDEVTVLMQRVVVKLEVEVEKLKALGEMAAQNKRTYEVAFSQWMLLAKVERPDLRSDAMRESWILQDTDTGVVDARFEADRAERLYKDQLQVVRAIQHQGDQLRSMLSRHKDMERTWHPGRDQPSG